MVIEMDASMVVKAVKSKEYPRAYWGKIATKGGDLLSQHPNISIRCIGKPVIGLLITWLNGLIVSPIEIDTLMRYPSYCLSYLKRYDASLNFFSI
jgi:hypothetical protein